MAKYNLSNSSKARLEGIHPFLKEVISLALEDSPEDFGIPPFGGLRTAKDQQELYAKGRIDFSTHNKPVTYVDGIHKKSRHQIQKSGYGEAFDVYIYCHEKKRASWNVERLTKLAIHILKTSEIIKEENPEFRNMVLTWGGNWNKFKDYPHFQVDYV